jgi:hypothetical protein
MKFDHNLCILFLYHKCDPLTKFHLSSLAASNPNSFILPLTDSVPELLPGSVDVGVFPSTFEEGQKWRTIDTTVYRWFENRTFNARRYLLVEYDCLCNVDLEDYYREVLDAEVAVIDYFTPKENPRWKWFGESELSKLPPEDRKYAGGVVPFTCTMFSHDALARIVDGILRNDIFSELRLGTAVRKLGLDCRRLPVPKRSTITWHGYPWRTDGLGLFHSVKVLDHNNGKPRRPGDIAARFHDWFRSLTRDREFLPFHLNGRREGLKRRLGMAKRRENGA